MLKEYIAYLRDNPQRYWFRAKLFGWGWTPARWQGWLSIIVYLYAVGLIFRDVDQASHSASDTLIGVFVPFALLTIGLIAICYLTGEKPKWNWGVPDKYKHK